MVFSETAFTKKSGYVSMYCVMRGVPLSFNDFLHCPFFTLSSHHFLYYQSMSFIKIYYFLSGSIEIPGRATPFWRPRTARAAVGRGTAIRRAASRASPLPGRCESYTRKESETEPAKDILSLYALKAEYLNLVIERGFVYTVPAPPMMILDIDGHDAEDHLRRPVTFEPPGQRHSDQTTCVD